MRGASGASTAQYQIARSLRFNSADSTSLSRSNASAGNRKTWTLSTWIKRSTVGVAAEGIYSVNNGEDQIRFTSTDSLQLGFNNFSSANLITTQVFRDVSAWYHIIIAIDTTQATSTNRVKIYVNGSQVTSFSTSTYPNQDFQSNFNFSPDIHRIGSGTNTTLYLNGYQTEVNVIVGQALTPSSFGETDASTGVWKPKRYLDTYGTNGFYLNFSDNSNTTAATLGKDYSSNASNWTPNNFSVTAGAGNDSLVDVPTPYGEDTGAGGTVRGNYATFNPLRSGTLARTFTNGNLAVAGDASNFATTATIGVSSGKWYWEVTATLVTDNRFIVGVADSTWPTSGSGDLGDSTYSYGYIADGRKYNNGSTPAYGATYTTNDIIGVALNMDAGTLTFYKNGTSQGQAFSGITQQMLPAIGSTGGTASESAVINFGQRPFAYTAPSGFKALCTQNLPTPTIGATSATLAGKFFDTSIWAGNDDNVNPRLITSNVDLASGGGLIWAKGRDLAVSHYLVDSVRGYTKYLATNGTAAEDTANFGIAGTTNGFTFTTSSGSLNQSPYNYVGWQWKAGGTAVTNTSGSITSSVSASTTSGFSVVTYTGNGTAGATIGHGLGATPAFLIFKSRSRTTNDWKVWCNSLTNTEALFLNLTNAKATGQSAFLNSTTPTSSVITLGTDSDVNFTSATYVAYCFAPVAGYSAMGSYTGNGNANGTFVYTGFRPAFILVKASSGGSAASANWLILDDARNTSNEVNNKLAANLSTAENGGTIGTSTQNNYDFLSNGFKARTTNGSSNESGTTFIYMAFAENPFKYSLAR